MSKPTIFAFNDLLNGADGALDSIDGAILVDKDLAVGVDLTNFYPYQLKAASGAAENSPLVISPDANAGDKRWLLKSGVFAGLTLYGNIVMPDGGTIGTATQPSIVFDTINGFLDVVSLGIRFGWASPGLGLVGFFYDTRNTEGFRIGIFGDYPLTFWQDSNRVMTIDAGNVNIGLGSIAKTKLTVEGAITLLERASADGDNVGYGQIFVKNTTPCQLWFRRDDGSEIRLDA